MCEVNRRQQSAENIPRSFAGVFICLSDIYTEVSLHAGQQQSAQPLSAADTGWQWWDGQLGVREFLSVISGDSCTLFCLT